MKANTISLKREAVILTILHLRMETANLIDELRCLDEPQASDDIARHIGRVRGLRVRLQAILTDSDPRYWSDISGSAFATGEYIAECYCQIAKHMPDHVRDQVIAEAHGTMH